jgi:hypothetical protein
MEGDSCDKCDSLLDYVMQFLSPGSDFLFSGYSLITSGIYKANLLDRSDAAEPSGQPIFN